MASISGLAAQTMSIEQDELISIRLEDCDQSLSVSKALLCSTSEYFVKALGGSFAEASTRTLTLPGCDIDTFRLYLFYNLNGRRLWDADHPAIDIAKGQDGWEQVKSAQVAMARLWVFGDAYLMPKLQNAATEVLLSIFEYWTPSSRAVAWVFKNTAETSLLRDLFVSQAVSDCIKNGNSHANMDKLGMIPGFFRHFTEVLIQCRGKKKLECNCEKANGRFCVPSECPKDELAKSKWYVKT